MIGQCVSNNYVSNASHDSNFFGDMLGNIINMSSVEDCNIYGDCIDNAHVIYHFCSKCKINGDLSSNDTDISLSSNSNKCSAVLEDSTLEGLARQPIRIYQNAGNWLPAVTGDAHFQTPPSGNSWALEAIPNSYCEDNYCNQLELSPLDEMALDAEAGSQTLTFKIYPVGWTTALNQNDVVLEARYLDSASGISRTTVSVSYTHLTLPTN